MMTTEERLEQVENELARGKRRGRWLMAVVVVAVTGFVSLGIGKQDPETIRAGRFILVDATGRSRAVLGVLKDGPGLWLYDETEKNRVALTARNGGQALDLYDENGNAMPQ